MLNPKSLLLIATNGLLAGLLNPAREFHERFLASDPSSYRVIEVSSEAAMIGLFLRHDIESVPSDSTLSGMTSTIDPRILESPDLNSKLA